MAEFVFKNAPKGSKMRKIYDEKINKIPNEHHLNDIGYKGAIDYLLNDSALVFVESEPFFRMPEYPCKITQIKTLR